MVYTVLPASEEATDGDGPTPTNVDLPCSWQNPARGNRWKRRLNLRDLKVGDKLSGFVVQELLDGKTGAKIFFECGVGRTNSKGEWSMVNGMLRLERAKKSVIKKRAARLKKKEEVDLHVARVQHGCGRLEVCLNAEDVEKFQSPPKVPVSSLSPKQEVTGKVTKVLDYGVMVDVGANRVGLLHIQKVADLYGRYIAKEKGLIEAGLERGALVRLQVESVESRRLSLDFTEDVKNEDENSKASVDDRTTEEHESAGSNDVEGGGGMSAEELAEWAAFASEDDVTVPATGAQTEPQNTEYDEYEGYYEGDDDDDDDYDEDKSIEDSLGIGYY